MVSGSKPLVHHVKQRRMLLSENTPPQATPVQSVWRALDLLEAFPKYGPELGLTAIADALGLSKATAYRLLSTLEARGYVERCPDSRKYRLGARTLELGAYFQSQLDIRRLALPFLRRMAAETNEAAFLCIREDDEALCIERVEAQQQVNIFTLRVGGRQPLHCGGAPRALLAGMHNEQLRAYAKRTGLPSFTPYTISTWDELMRDVENTRRQGYVLSQEDVVEGIAAIGAPVHNHTGKVVAAISLSGLVARYNAENVPQLAQIVLFNARAISNILGYREA